MTKFCLRVCSSNLHTLSQRQPFLGLLLRSQVLKAQAEHGLMQRSVHLAKELITPLQFRWVMIDEPFFFFELEGSSQSLHLILLHLLLVHFIKFMGVLENWIRLEELIERFLLFPMASDIECFANDLAIVMVKIAIGPLGHKITSNNVVFDRSVDNRLFTHLIL